MQKVENAKKLISQKKNNLSVGMYISAFPTPNPV